MNTKLTVLKHQLNITKNFIEDGNLLPEKSLFFYIRFIPFAEFRQELDINQ